MNYVCFGNKVNFAILDRVNQKYVSVKDGMLYYDTDKSEKMYKKYYKKEQLTCNANCLFFIN